MWAREQALNVDFGSSFNVLSISEVALDSFAVEFWGRVVLYTIVLSSMMLLTFVRAHDELVYFMFTNTIAQALGCYPWKQLY